MTDRTGYDALASSAGAYAPASHGQFEVSGPDAHAFVNRVCTVDITKVPPGRFADALLLRDDATILARVTVYRFADLVMLLVEGELRADAWGYLVERKRGNVRLRDISDDVAVIAVRGPAAAGRLATLLAPVPESPGDLLRSRLAGVDVFAARATRHGPDGVDLYCRSRDVHSLRSSIERLGIPFVDAATWGLVRLEWGLPRVGAEIDPEDTPVEAGLEDLVAQGKGAPFPGEVALANRRQSGPLKQLTGFTVEGSEPPPVGSEVQMNGRVVDRVRSSAVSPRAGVIGMTAVPKGTDVGSTTIRIVAADREWQGELRRPPFVGRQS